jgi:hypothetical protein
MDVEQLEIHAWHICLKFPLFWTCQPTNFFLLSMLPSMMPLGHTIQNQVLFGPTFFFFLSVYFCSISGKTCIFCMFQVRVVCGSLWLYSLLHWFLPVAVYSRTFSGNFWTLTTVLMNLISWASSLSLSLGSRCVEHFIVHLMHTNYKILRLLK